MAFPYQRAHPRRTCCCWDARCYTSLYTNGIFKGQGHCIPQEEVRFDHNPTLASRRRQKDVGLAALG
jgi:hypothetical protein